MAFVLVVGAQAQATDSATLVSDVGSRLGDTQAVQTRLVDASKGTFAPAATAIVAGGGQSGAFVDNVLQNGSLADMSVVAGTYAVAGANIGSGTANAIGGSGGVIALRQGSLMAERKAVSEFGDNSALASIRMNQSAANRIWASPFYTHQKMDNKDGYAGYTYKAWGASVGYDRAFGDFVFGGAFTYSKGDYDEKGARDDNDINNYGVSLYGQYYNACNGFFATLGGGYNYGDNDWKRWVDASRGWLNGDNHTNTWWLGGNIGWDYQVNESFTLTPTIGLFWSEAKNSGYTTTGVVGQNFSKINSKSLLMPIDLAATYKHQIDECSSVSFKVSGGYAYNFKRDRAEGSFTYNGFAGNPIFIQGVKPSRHSWNVGAGVTYQVRNVDFGVDYRYDGASKFDAHRVSATVGLSF